MYLIILSGKGKSNHFPLLLITVHLGEIFLTLKILKGSQTMSLLS